jgi:hypothetical protein
MANQGNNTSPIASIYISAPTLTVHWGDPALGTVATSVQATATVYDTAGKVVQTNVSWRREQVHSCIYVDKNGVVTATNDTAYSRDALLDSAGNIISISYSGLISAHVGNTYGYAVFSCVP